MDIGGTHDDESRVSPSFRVANRQVPSREAPERC